MARYYTLHCITIVILYRDGGWSTRVPTIGVSTMTKITRATAFSNNEVAYIAWEIDGPTIPSCLGFNIVREFLNAAGAVIEAKPLAAYVAFKGQHNPEGLAQNTTV